MRSIVLAQMLYLGCMMSSESSVYAYMSLCSYPAKPLNACSRRLKCVEEGTHSLCVMTTVTMLGRLAPHLCEVCGVVNGENYTTLHV